MDIRAGNCDQMDTREPQKALEQERVLIQTLLHQPEFEELPLQCSEEGKYGTTSVWTFRVTVPQHESSSLTKDPA